MFVARPPDLVAPTRELSTEAKQGSPECLVRSQSEPDVVECTGTWRKTQSSCAIVRHIQQDMQEGEGRGRRLSRHSGGGQKRKEWLRGTVEEAHLSHGSGHVREEAGVRSCAEVGQQR